MLRLIIFTGIVYTAFRLIRNSGLSHKTNIEPNTTDKNYPPVPYSSVKTANFSIEEMRCKDGTAVPNEFTGNALHVLSQIQVLRDYLGVPIRIHSGYRTVSHNKDVGGAPASKHMRAMATDIVATGKTPAEVRTAIAKLQADGKMQTGGLGSYNTFTHYDVSTPRGWAD